MPIDLSPISAILRDIGVSLTASAIYDFLKSKFQGREQIECAVVERELDAYLKVHGVKAEAATVITAFADSGFLSIKDSHLFAPDAILIGAGEGARFSFGQNSSSSTSTTAIHATGNALVEGANSGMSQNADGSISFMVGNSPGSSMNFFVGNPQPASKN
jgi:hypothetical protein